MVTEKYDLLKMENKLKKYLDEERLWHTLGVMHMAAALSMVHGCDMVKAQVAGLLHDCAKCIPSKKKLKLCKEHRIQVTDVEKEHPFLLHAKVGAWVAREKYGIEDPEILEAVIWHTTGKENMSLLEKIIYIADYIEPDRCKAPGLDLVRKLAFEDLDMCMYQILKDTLDYLGENPEEIDQHTRKAYDYYKEKIESKEAVQ